MCNMRYDDMEILRFFREIALDVPDLDCYSEDIPA